MDPQMILHIALSISTPVAGVVGFVIQLREVKKAASKMKKFSFDSSVMPPRATPRVALLVPCGYSGSLVVEFNLDK
jgi:hypothetical protein